MEALHSSRGIGSGCDLENRLGRLSLSPGEHIVAQAMSPVPLVGVDETLRDSVMVPSCKLDLFRHGPHRLPDLDLGDPMGVFANSSSRGSPATEVRGVVVGYFV